MHASMNDTINIIYCLMYLIYLRLYINLKLIDNKN